MSILNAIIIKVKQNIYLAVATGTLSAILDSKHLPIVNAMVIIHVYLRLMFPDF